MVDHGIITTFLPGFTRWGSRLGAPVLSPWENTAAFESCESCLPFAIPLRGNAVGVHVFACSKSHEPGGQRWLRTGTPSPPIRGFSV